MPEFVASPIVNAGFDPQDVQKNALNIATSQQDLQDRATYRAAAPGLLSGDPNDTGQAMGANPTATQGYLNSIPSADQNTRLQSASDIGAVGALASATLNAPAKWWPGLL